MAINRTETEAKADRQLEARERIGIPFTSESARKAAETRWQRERERRAQDAELLRAPRETIADELMQRPQTLRQAVRATMDAAAAGDTAAQRILFGWLDQGYGKTDTKAPETLEDAGLPSLTREEKALLLAGIDAELERRDSSAESQTRE